MKQFLAFGLLVLCLGVFDKSYAQEVIAVPFASGSFEWEKGPTGSAPDEYVITCGANSVTVKAPTTKIDVKDVVPGPGTYDCTIFARNVFGRSELPDSHFPEFVAGNPPDQPINLRIVVQ